MKKRFHELDMENKKLAHDREELARAYKVHKKDKFKFETLRPYQRSIFKIWRTVSLDGKL